MLRYTGTNEAVECIFDLLGWRRDVELERTWRGSLEKTPWTGRRMYRGCWWLKQTLMVYRPKPKWNVTPHEGLVPLPPRPTAAFSAAYDEHVRRQCGHLRVPDSYLPRAQRRAKIEVAAKV